MRPAATMYNLNLAGASANNLLTVAQGESSSTPRTPEILNSLIAMSNPFDSYRGGGSHGPRLASSPPSGSDTNSTCSSGSPSCVSPPSVQLTCSKLIKEGLRHTLQTKRRNNSVSSDAQLSSIEDGSRTCKTEELTPEDEERRRRRRERNKIAATKCRMKKRERTVNLVQESEILETQNHDLKSQIQELEIQRKRLVDMLSGHRPSCKQTAAATATASNFATSEQQTYHHHHLEAAGSSCSRSSSTVETMVYQRVNICNHPSTTTLDSRLSYRRLEVSASDYPRPADSLTPPPYDDNTTVQSSYDSKSPYATAVQSPYNTGVQSPCTTVQTYEKNVQSPYTTGVQSPCTTVQSYEKNVQSPYNTGVQSPCTTVQSYEKNVQSPYTTGVQSPCPTPFDAKTVHSPYNPTVQSPYDAKTVQSSPYEPNYQSSYHDEAVKDDDEVWRSGSGSSLNTQFGRISTTDSGYSCLSSSGMNSPMPFLQSDDGPAYSRTIFSRPTSLDVSTSDYDSNAEIVDSPTMATLHNYRHYESADSAYCANYVPPPSSNRGGCIS